MGDSSNPYVGLRPFDVEERLLFFGRNEQTLELLQRLHKHHFVAVVGSSGSGKSSLLRAGLIPALKAGFLVDDSDRWCISIMKPGHNPIFNLAESLLLQTNSKVTTQDIITLSEKIEEEGVDAILKLISPIGKNKNVNFFLLVDQFEELFRYSMDKNKTSKKDEAIDFVNIILELSEQSLLPFYVVFTMRSDFIGDCTQFYGLPEAMNKSQFLVPRLNRQQLKMVIAGPAKLFGGKIDSSLTSKLLNNIKNVKDELPLLQHVLMRIWDYEKEVDKDRNLGLRDYNNVGGIEKALSLHADEALEKMNEEELEIAKNLFKALTEVDENGRKIRRPVLLSELKELTSASEKKLLEIIDSFIRDGRSFLMINNADNINDKVIDISHESLIRQWQTLYQWVDEEDEAASYYKQLAEATRLNLLEKRDLLTGIELQLALDWRKRFKPVEVWAKRYREGFKDSILFLNKSEEAWIQLKNKDARKKREKRLTYAVLTLFLVIIVGAGFATNYIINKNKELKSRDEAFRLHFTALDIEKKNPTIALRLEEAAMNIYDFRSFNNAAAAIYKKHSFYDILVSDKNCSGLGIFSPDGKHILTGSLDSIARLYDLKGAITTTYVGHTDEITSIAFSKDGTKVLTGSKDKTARLWNVDGSLIQIISGHIAAVQAVTFSFDGTKILSGSKDSTAILWKLDGTKIHVFKGESKGITSVAFSPDDSKIVTGSVDSYTRIWNIDGTLIQKIGHSDEIWTVAFSPDGTKVLAASEDATVGLYGMKGDTIRKYTLHSDAVMSAVFSPDGNSILTCSRDATARLWTIGGTVIQKFIGHPDEIHTADFSPDGKQIITGGVGNRSDTLLGNIRLWDIKNQVLEFDGHSNIVVEAVFSPDGSKILTGSYDGSAILWSIDGKNIKEFQSHAGTIESVAFSPDSTKILTSGSDKLIKLWDLEANLLQKFEGHTATVLCVAFSPDGFNIVSGSFDGSIRRWDLQGNLLSKIEGNNLRNIQGNFGGIWYLAYSPDGTKILAGCEDGTTRLFDLDFNLLQEYKGHTDGIGCARFSPDGTKILTGSEDFTVRLWNIDGTLIHLYDNQSDEVFAVDFSPDGKSIVIGSDDGKIGFYDLEGNKFNEISSDSNFINSVTYSSDGKSLLVALSNDTALLWDTTPAMPLIEFLQLGVLETFSEKQKKEYGIEMNASKLFE